MHLSEAVFKHTRIVYFLLLAVFVGGIFSYLKLSKLEDPEIEIIAANVITVYPGASAPGRVEGHEGAQDELDAFSDIRWWESALKRCLGEVTLEMTVPKMSATRLEFCGVSWSWRYRVRLRYPDADRDRRFQRCVRYVFRMTAESLYQDMNDMPDYLRYNLWRWKA